VQGVGRLITPPYFSQYRPVYDYATRS